jgi:hypothetical protein
MSNQIIDLPDGSAVNASSIVAIRVSNGYPSVDGRPALKPRVNIDFVVGKDSKSIVIDCRTDAERDTVADECKARWKGAVK